jgi:hypothetical protein
MLRLKCLACTQRRRVLKWEIRLRVAELEELERRTDLPNIRGLVQCPQEPVIPASSFVDRRGRCALTWQSG